MSRHSGSLSTGDYPSGDVDLDILLRMLAKLYETRIQKNLTLRELSTEMGISFAHLSRAERGLSQPGLVVLLRWCRALELDFGELWQIAKSADAPTVPTQLSIIA